MNCPKSQLFFRHPCLKVTWIAAKTQKSNQSKLKLTKVIQNSTPNRPVLVKNSPDLSDGSTEGSLFSELLELHLASSCSGSNLQKSAAKQPEKNMSSADLLKFNKASLLPVVSIIGLINGNIWNHRILPSKIWLYPVKISHPLGFNYRCYPLLFRCDLRSDRSKVPPKLIWNSPG